MREGNRIKRKIFFKQVIYIFIYINTNTRIFIFIKAGFFLTPLSPKPMCRGDI